MDAFRELAEQRIREARDNGEFDDLPGKGKPLQLFENPHVSPELRVAFKLLQDAGIRPREVDLMRRVGELKAEIASEGDFQRLSDLKEELAQAQTELDMLLGRAIPCGCSRTTKRRTS